MEYEWLYNGYPDDENSYPISISDTPKQNEWGIIQIYEWNMNGCPMVIQVMKIHIPFIFHS